MVPVKYILAPSLLPTRISTVVCSKEVVLLLLVHCLWLLPMFVGFLGLVFGLYVELSVIYSFDIISLMKRNPVALFKLFSYCHVAVSVLL